MRATVDPLEHGTNINRVHFGIEEIIPRAHFYYEGLYDVFVIIVASNKKQRFAAQCRGRQKHVASRHRDTSLKMKTNEGVLFSNYIPCFSCEAPKRPWLGSRYDRCFHSGASC